MNAQSYNKPFLQYVAEDLVRKHGTNLSRIAVVFPNKRASLFMNQYLAHSTDRPLWSPSYVTISDLFRNNSKLQVADSIKLICDLHKVFVQITGMDETLDHFYGWGQLLLSDFDDIDKNMADAQKVFANLRDIHELDDVSYLTDEQKELLSRFFSNFSADQDSILRDRFLRLWSHFYEIYKAYNERLTSQGLAYEGGLYRKVVEEISDKMQSGEEVLMAQSYDVFVFVGFNMIQTVEQRLFEMLRKQGRALFYWDFDRYYMGFEAGHYISRFLEQFPNELDVKSDAIYNNFTSPKTITYLSSSTDNAQARYVSQWLTDTSLSRIKDGKKTAVVLCDESLLPAVVHCIPTEVDKANITTGYPLVSSPFISLINILIELKTDHNRIRLAKCRDRLRRHPYMQYIVDENLLNRNIAESTSSLFGDQLLDLTGWLSEILKHIGQNTHDEENDPFFQESLFRMYTIINRLHELILAGDLTAELSTFRRLLTQIVNTTTVPFHGEPAEGIQIMGVLETRNLDFDHILLLSCNEGSMPKGVNDSSFIPYSIRRAYGLTTIDHKVSIYAYYFHRLLQRAQDVTLVYNNSTDDGHKGEMSRFMLQLMVESPFKIQRKSLSGEMSIKPRAIPAIEKTENVMERLNDIKKLSPTAINKYLRCQLSFYYYSVVGLREDDSDNYGEIDSRGFGDIFHLAAQIIYDDLKGQKQTIEKSDLSNLLKHPEYLERIVDKAIAEVFRKRNIKQQIKFENMNGLQLINRRVIIDYIKQLLNIDMQYAPFQIVKTEETVSMSMPPTGCLQRSILLSGQIDRIDKRDGKLRVVDYKTGHKMVNNMPSVHDIFTGEMVGDHSDYFFQSMLYSVILREDKQRNPMVLPVSPALLYIQHSRADNYDPIIKIADEPIDDIHKYQDEFMKELEALLADIFDPAKPFSPTDEQKRCQTCPYKKLCN